MSILESQLQINSNNIKKVYNGGLTSINNGQGVQFLNLLNQPMALVVYNNNSNDAEINVLYNNQKPIKKTLLSVDKTSSSIGFAYVFNPAVSKSNSITLSISAGHNGDASVTAYVVSQGLPILENNSPFQNLHIKANGEWTELDGYSRCFAPTQLAWYEFVIKSNTAGLIGFLFGSINQEENLITVAGINVPDEISIEKLMIIDKSLGNKVSFETYTGNKHTFSFYGDSGQIFYSPISSLKENCCEVALQRL